jgi:DNA-binding NarL/FixJ family response regulator
VIETRDSQDPIRVILVDDHQAILEGMTTWINRQPDMQMIGSVSDANLAMKLIEKEAPQVAIVDLSLRDSDGIDLIKRILLRSPEINVLVCSMYPEIPYAQRALNSGAKGYISKDCSSEEIIEAIRTIADGKYHTSKAVSEWLLKAQFGRKKMGASPNRGTYEDLSDRELQVFEHIGKGLTTIEIASRLHLSSHTVETYRQRMKAKLGIKHNSELGFKATQWVLEKQKIDEI